MKASLASLAAAVGLASLAPATALACGGFFCNATPVDQQAERIIFVQEDSDTVTSYVEIVYQGEPDGFAWVVPVPSVPLLDVWHGGAFNALDLLTEPQFELPWACLAEAGAFDDADGAPDPAPGGDVEVLDRQRVGPFDTATIESDDPRALVEWLRVNDYRITPAMEPFIAMYTREGLKFLAMKLAPGEETDSIQPIKMTYDAAGPMVPLRLTAVAAQLEMGVKVWVLGDARYGASGVPDITIEDADLRFDPNTWQTNYLALVARKVDENGGKGFITELAGPTAALAQQVRDSFVPEWAGQEAVDARDALAALLDSRPYVTRLYTRLSPEEMDHDPSFVRIGGDDVANRRVVPAPDGQQDACGGWGVEDVDACDFAACGAGGACAEADVGNGRMEAGCACAAGTLARAGRDPNGNLSVGCADVRLNFTAPGLELGPVAFADVCAQGDFCGADGECVMLNGFPSCRCDAGFVAVPTLDEMGMPVARCVAPAAPLDPRAVAAITLREPNLPYPGRTTELADPTQPQDGRRGGGSPSAAAGCSATPGAPALPAWMLVLPLLGLAIRRR